MRISGLNTFTASVMPSRARGDLVPKTAMLSYPMASIVNSNLADVFQSVLLYF